MPRGAGLSPERVVELALAVLDREGPDRLTLARVADAAGVATPSLYKHIEGLPDLRERVAGRVVAELTDRVREAVIGVSGDAATLALMTAYRSYLVAYPRRAGLLVMPTNTDRHADELLGVVLAVLRGYGLTGSAAIHAARALRASVYGFATLEAAGGFGLPEDLDESFRRLAALLVAGLPGLSTAGTEGPPVGRR
jgi:AcrR family transcriptional regulator